MDYAQAMPPDLGMMLNDALGDCTCAAFYHALQVWSFNASPPMDTEPDADVEALYEQACGYDPNTPGEGPGGNEQHVLTYLLRTGAPIGPDGAGRQKLAAFVEIDPRVTDDVKRAIYHCGVAYIGFKVPQFIDPPDGPAPKVWDVNGGDPTLVGGHAVVLPGYDADGFKVISWGGYYTMTYAFFAQYVDEVYALADARWIAAKGTTPGGLSLADLELQMQALKGA